MPGAQLYRWDFTFFLPEDVGDTKTDPARWADTVTKALDSLAKHYIFQCERTPTTNRLHMQGYLNLKKKITQGPLGGLLGSTLPGISVRPASTEGTNALQTYTMKTDTRVLGPWMDKTTKSKNLTESDMSNWMIPGIDPRYPLLKYQQMLIEHMEKEHEDRRTIYWLYDAEGNTGKSGIKDNLVARKKTIPLGWMPVVDFRHQVAENKGLPVYIIDLTRQKPKGYSVQDLYAALEDIKGGCFMSTKYKGGMVYMRSPNVWVFSNNLPEMNRLSRDRWIILETYGVPPHIKIREYKDPEKISCQSDVPPEIRTPEQIPKSVNPFKKN